MWNRKTEILKAMQKKRRRQDWITVACVVVYVAAFAGFMWLVMG